MMAGRVKDIGIPSDAVNSTRFDITAKLMERRVDFIEKTTFQGVSSGSGMVTLITTNNGARPRGVRLELSPKADRVFVTLLITTDLHYVLCSDLSSVSAALVAEWLAFERDLCLSDKEEKG